jgi:hypothetical protein
MKAKVSTGKGFAGLMKYAQKEDAKFISSTAGENQKDFLRACAKLRESRPDCKVPVIHISLSLPPPERLNQEGWAEAIAEFQQEMRLEEHDFFAVQHRDADHDHVHLIVSKIHPSGTLWKDSSSARRAMAACEKIEKKLCLTKTKTLDEFRAETGQNRQKIRDPELKMMSRTGTIGDRRKAAIAKKISKQRTKTGEQENRAFEQNGITGRSRIEQRKINQKAVPTDKSSFGKTSSESNGIRKKVGEIRSRQIGEAVNFTKTGVLIARMDTDKIELYSVDDDAIRFAIEQARKSGKVPLEPFSDNPNFMSKVRRIAAEIGVPVRDEKAELEMKQAEELILKKAAENTQKQKEENENFDRVHDTKKPTNKLTQRI